MQHIRFDWLNYFQMSSTEQSDWLCEPGFEDNGPEESLPGHLFLYTYFDTATCSAWKGIYLLLLFLKVLVILREFTAWKVRKIIQHLLNIKNI